MTVNFRSGYVKGAGAAINVELGWIPDRVEIANLTDGDDVTTAYMGRKVIPFTSGGTATVAAGQTIVGVTSLARARISEVILNTGTFAGGDAAGWFITEKDDITGTFQSENATILGTSGTDDVTVVAAIEYNIKVTTAAASAVTTSAVSSYLGSRGSASKGFTIGSVLAESAKLLCWSAWRNVL